MKMGKRAKEDHYAFEKKFISCVMEEFAFLQKEGYVAIHESVSGPSCGVRYESKENKRKIFISKSITEGSLFGDAYFISIHRQNKSFWALFNYKEEKYAEYLTPEHVKSVDSNIKLPTWMTEENYKMILATYSTFIKQHFMPVIRGEKWIDNRI